MDKTKAQSTAKAKAKVKTTEPVVPMVMDVDHEYDYNGENVISAFFDVSAQQFELILLTALEAVNSSWAHIIFNHYPPRFNAIAQRKGVTIQVYIKGLNIDLRTIIGIMTTTPTDHGIFTLVGADVYTFLKYIVVTTTLYFTTTHKLLVAPSIPACKQYKIIHNATSEAKLKGHNTLMFFHGSGIDNWYNIMRIGLRITRGENTKLMRNANAYGQAIYISNTHTVSLGYCRPGTYGQYIIAICEVIESEAKKQTEGIYTITNEDAILIRYFIQFTDETLKNPIFTKDLANCFLRLIKNSLITPAKLKRLTIEGKRLVVDPTIEGFHIKANTSFYMGDYISKWRIIMPLHPFTDTRLIHQMLERSVEGIELEVVFGSNFPFSPPFIRIVSPRFTRGSIDMVDFLDRGGGFCTALFKTGQWTPTTSMISLIIYIHNVIYYSDVLELDPEYWTQEYDEREALSVFNPVFSGLDMVGAIDILDDS